MMLRRLTAAVASGGGATAPAVPVTAAVLESAIHDWATAAPSAPQLGTRQPVTEYKSKARAVSFKLQQPHSDFGCSVAEALLAGQATPHSVVGNPGANAAAVLGRLNDELDARYRKCWSACESGEPENVIVLLAEVSESAAEELGADACRVMVNHRSASGQTLLHAASTRGQIDLIRKLICHYDAEMEVRDRFCGRTPLHCAGASLFRLTTALALI